MNGFAAPKPLKKQAADMIVKEWNRISVMGPPVVKSLKQLRAAEDHCTRCPLYADAIQAVPGEGPLRARLMLVGEQPGDQEDRQGHPFVGPAGRILDQAIVGAGLDRSEVFVTNAVKHFKHEMRGKRRLHKRPNTYEIDRCKWWLNLELAIVKPKGVVALGATAARSLFGRPVPIEKSRRKLLELDDGTPVFVTRHPSAMLRIEDRAERHALIRQFTGDLRYAAKHLPT